MRLLSVDDYTQRPNNQPMKWADIGKRVKLRRVDKGLTQEELATKAKVGLGTVQALEDAPNRRTPRQTTPRKLQQIADALEMPLDDLIVGRESISASDARLDRLTDEDIDVARLFHESVTDVRNCALALFRDGKAHIGLRLCLLPSEFADPITAMIIGAETELTRRREVAKKESAKRKPLSQRNTTKP